MQNSHSLLSRVVLLVLVVGLLTACAAPKGSAPVQPAASPTSIALEAPQVSPTPASTAGFTVTDALNRQVTFKTAPQRIVFAGQASFMLADAIYTFPEAASRLVALGNTVQWKNDFIPIVDPNLKGKPILDTQVGPEQIAAEHPDLVLLKSFLAERLGKPLEQLGIPVVYVQFETPAQYQRDIAVLGQIFQNEQRARQVAAFFQQHVDRIQQALSGLTQEQKPRILLLYYTNKDGQVAFNVPPTGYIQTQLAEMAGAQPIWTDIQLGSGWTKVNFEQIAAWDPDQVFIIAYTSDAVEVVKKLEQDPQWQALRATKDGKLYPFPMDIYSWDQPDTRWILGLTWLAGRLHPDRFPDLDMKQELFSFYKDLYRLDEKTVQEKILPHLQGVQP